MTADHAGGANESWEFDPERPESVERVGVLLTRANRLCERLDALGERQRRSVEATDTESLLEVLGERQTLVDQLCEVDRLLEPVRVIMAGGSPRLAAPRRASWDALVKQLSERIERISASDARDREELARQRSRLADELAGAQRGQGAIGAYRSDGTGARFQDRRA